MAATVFRHLLMHYDKSTYYIKFSKEKVTFTDSTKLKDSVEVQSNTNWILK